MFTINYLSDILGLRIIQSSLRQVGKAIAAARAACRDCGWRWERDAGFCVRRVCSDRRDRRDAYGFEIGFKD